MTTATGPKTEEGKSRSKANSYKHGLTGQTLLLTADERVFYDQHVQGYMDLYKPASHGEKVLVQIIADDYWRAMQGRALETARLRLTFEGQLDEDTSAILSPSTIWLHNEKALCNLALYLQRIERSIKNNTQALEVMQNERKAAQRQAEEEVKVLARATWAEGRPYNPARDFPPEGEFVFSPTQVEALITREDRVNYAQTWNRWDFDRSLKPSRPAYQVQKAA